MYFVEVEGLSEEGEMSDVCVWVKIRSHMAPCRF